jgi:hypothetical protein
MNEQIRLLADQAGISTNLDTAYFEKDIGKWIDYYSVKLAELIVKECAEVSLKSSHRDDDMGAIIARHINEHFGVEE